MKAASSDGPEKITQVISTRLAALWDAWRSKDSSAQSAILVDQYSAVYADSTLHTGTPTAY